MLRKSDRERRAGYSFAEELPIFLLIFLVPVAAAVLIRKFF